MATTARAPKQARKADPARRPPAWSSGARASPTFSPAGSNARLPNVSQPASPAAFPPLGQPNGGPRNDKPQDRVLQQLSGLTGTTITLSTKTKQRYEGVVASTSGEGDTTGVTLKDVKELTQPGAPLKESFFIASTNIDTWASGPADAKAPNGTDTFKTDTDISQKGLSRRERELQAWQPSSPEASTQPSAPPNAGNTDELTFGPGAATGKQAWDQFDANEKLFGIKTSFNEDEYTTPLNKDAPDYKEKEKKAQAVAAEILGTATNNPHIAEERVMNFAGGESTNEEDKYGAVVRSANAYVPPGARKGNAGGVAPSKDANAKPEIPKLAVNAPDGSAVSVNANTASPANKPADAVPAFREFVSSEKDRLIKKRQALVKNEMDKRMAELIKFSKTFKVSASSVPSFNGDIESLVQLNKPIPDDLVPILAKDEEKQRQIKEKSSKDAESNQARAIGPLNTTAPAGTTNAINASATSTRLNQPSALNSAKPPAAIPEIAKQAQGTGGLPAAKSTVGISGVGSAGKNGKPAETGKRISMYIQPIPPFKGKRNSTAPSNGSSSASPAASAQNGGVTPPTIRTSSGHGAAPAGPPTPLSPGAANRLNVNASSFRPNGKPFSPVASPSVNGASPSPKPGSGKSAASENQPTTPNPFFGTTRPNKKNVPVSIKEDFNPFKHNKVAEASQVAPTWPYNGKRYMLLFPPLPAPPQQPQQPQSPQMAPPGPPPPMPPSTYEEDPAAAAQAQAQAPRGYVYAYPPYGYPGQPMMPGMPPPPPGYMPGPYMQPMPYPHMPPPNAMYPPTPMGQMPPPQFMPPPPPGTYPPPPNGAGPRPSMPPTPIPSHAHAHPYYHQSPQLQHAVPYPMMMPPHGAPGVPPHPYEGAPAPPVPMGGVTHG
ncbi:hypothetical protein K474DRAFT_1706190 [Panus rudis PR-1116 ss-1]|nr:hypothetical protein K474DRAFT_1706190 [Panus rudis PR-1116 ss-1]